MVERNPGWRWRTVLEDSDGLAIATQDTIHLPKHWASPNACIMHSLSSPSDQVVLPLQSSSESGLQVVIVAYQATIRLLPPFVECLKDMAPIRESLQALCTAKPFNGAICQPVCRHPSDATALALEAWHRPRLALPSSLCPQWESLLLRRGISMPVPILCGYARSLFAWPSKH